MKLNFVVGIFFILLAVGLMYLSLTNKLGDGLLDRADKVASVVSLAIAIFAFINPFAEADKDSGQQVTFGDNTSGQINIGQAKDGASVTIGDTSTSAAQRADNAAEQIKVEALKNFSELAVLIQAVERQSPEEFWDKRRTNETELAYQDRATNHFRDYVQGIDEQIKLLKFSTSSYDAYRRDLSHTPKMAQRAKQVYDAQSESADAFNRLRSSLQGLLEPGSSDVIRTDRARSLYRERLIDAKIALSQAAAHFSLVADADDMNLLADSFSIIGVDAQWESGKEGYRQGMELARQFNKEKISLIQESLGSQKLAIKREIDRRINDPYLLRIRELAGLPKELTRSELERLQNLELDTTEQDPEKLLKLAYFSYSEMDGAAATSYLQRALDTGELSSTQTKYVEASIQRIQKPEHYDGSLGVMIIKLDDDSNFAKAGLTVGDVILSADGQVVNEPLEIATALAQSSNKNLVLKVVRGDQKLAISVESQKSAGAALTQLILLNALQV